MTDAERNTLTELHNDVRELRDKITELCVAIQTHIAAEGACQQVVEGLKETVWGNGKEGLKIRVDRLEQSRSRAMWALTTGVGLVCSVLGSLAYLLIQKLLK